MYIITLNILSEYNLTNSLFLSNFIIFFFPMISLRLEIGMPFNGIGRINVAKCSQHKLKKF